MHVMVVLLAVIGALVLARMVIRSAVSTARILRAANAFQAASVEAVNAIRDARHDELRQFTAVAAWEQARAFIRTLPESEQVIVAQTLRDRSFLTSEVVAGITAFMEAKDRETPDLDADLATILVN